MLSWKIDNEIYLKTFVTNYFFSFRLLVDSIRGVLYDDKSKSNERSNIYESSHGHLDGFNLLVSCQCHFLRWILHHALCYLHHNFGMDVYLPSGN